MQDNAILRRQALKIRLTLESEYKLGNDWRRNSWMKGRQNVVTVGTTETSVLSAQQYYSRFMAWLDPETRITIKKVYILIVMVGKI